MPITGLAIAAGLGLAKSELVDKPAADRQRKLAAATQQFSPWTGLKANPVKEADPAGSMLQYGAAGAQMGGAVNQANLQQAMADKLNAGGSIGGVGFSNPWGQGAGAASPPINYGQGPSGNYFGL